MTHYHTIDLGLLTTPETVQLGRDVLETLTADEVCRLVAWWGLRHRDDADELCEHLADVVNDDYDSSDLDDDLEE